MVRKKRFMRPTNETERMTRTDMTTPKRVRRSIAVGRNPSPISIRGKSTRVSKEHLRAIVFAALALLSYHNYPPPRSLVIRVSRKMRPGVMGSCRIEPRGRASVTLKSSLSPDEMLTTCVHELIHACIRFPRRTIEACTTRLNQRIKREIDFISHLLLGDTYKRAAFFAHTKISYVAKHGDFYDPGEDTPTGTTTKFLRTSRRSRN
jgi:hypothetical protein